MKVLFISETLPPARNGQGLMLYRLLQDRKPEDYSLASQNIWAAAPGERRAPEQLPGSYHQLTRPKQFDRGHRFGLVHLRDAVNVPLAVPQLATQITELIRRERCDAVVACTGDMLDMPAAFRASRRAGVPFYAYVFDHYSYREWRYPVRRFWARRFEPALMKGAAGVIVPNEILRDDLRERYGVEATLIHNSFDISVYESAAVAPAPARRNGEVKIVYTGDVYEAHYDAFRNLVAAIEKTGRDDLRLHVYSGRSPEDLAREGIGGPVACHGDRAPSEMPGVQREADLLFLPLAFNSPYPDLVRTSATTKLGEYLATGRPVLVHAPPDSFVSWYFREHDCGVLVDRLDPAALAEAIKNVLGDDALRQRLGARAWERARSDFDINAARSKFWNLLERGTPPRSR
jgi:glycosyltransferase involved in cell wall biosynthesis